MKAHCILQETCQQMLGRSGGGAEVTVIPSLLGLRAALSGNLVVSSLLLSFILLAAAARRGNTLLLTAREPLACAAA